MTETVAQPRQITIGEYVVTGKIGQGGIAEIYKAKQPSLDRDVAIKILSSKMTDDPDIVKRFERESIVIANLNHPNIVHVIDKGMAGGRYYFVMDYIDGTSLREVIDSPSVDLNTKLEMIVQACKGLDYAHKNGIVHRDIKPANILIDRSGNALVADFGIAQIIGSPETEVTSSEVIMGTLAYMSPEQKVSSTNVDHTTDIYAVGVILYEILVGKKPLGHFKLPSEISKRIDNRFDTVISKCLATDAKDRYQSAVELKDTILEIIGGGPATKEELNLSDSDSFMGKCRHLDTIKETTFSSTVLVENRITKALYVIKKHSRGEHGRKEAKLLTSLKHKNINNVLGSGGNRKTTVIVSSYAQGGSLSDRMARRYDWEKAVEVALAIASGLDFAHRNNIVHGNIRPSNILFDSSEEVKISDFKMPPHYDASGKKNWYAAPERKISKQGDIYALGVILHQLLTGRCPKYDNGSNLLLNDLGFTVPEDVQKMIKKLLAIRVAHRYASCEEFLLDWDDFNQRRNAKPKPAVKKQKQPVAVQQSIPVWAYFVVAALLIVAVMVGIYLGGGLR